MKAGSIEIEVGLNTKSFEAEIENVESKLNDLISDYKSLEEEDGFNEQSNDAKILRAEIEKTANQLQNLKKKQEELNKTNIPKLKDVMNEIGNSTERVIKKVARWGLALFGIRSAYMFIRQSMSTLSQYNKTLAADLQYIRFALASSLENIITNIIELVYKLLQYINYIANAWFGVNLFANASTKAFEKQNKALGGSVKQAKELKKQLTGIDEMNVLQDNGSVASGGGGGGVSLPSTDLSQLLTEAEVPAWVQWIADHGEDIKMVIIGIGEALLLLKLAKFANDIITIGKSFTLLNKVLIAGGIILAVEGLISLFVDLEKLFDEFTLDNVLRVLNDFSNVLIGLGVIILGLNLSNPWGWIVTGIGIIAKGISMLGDLFGAHEDEIDVMERERESVERLKEARDNLTSVTSSYTKAVKREEDASKNLKKVEEETGISGEKLYNKVYYGIIQYRNLTEEQRKVYDAYIEEKDAKEQLEKETEKFSLAKSAEKQAIIDSTAALVEQKKGFGEAFATVIDAYRNGEIRSKQFKDYVHGIFVQLSDAGRETFVKSLPDDILQTLLADEEFNRAIYLTEQHTSISFKDIANQAKNTFEKDIPGAMDKTSKSASGLFGMFDKLKSKISALNGGKISVSVGGFNYGNAKGGIVTRLATGAIVNQPGRGIPVASSYMGEAGREGILPLTDAQAMESLGQAIGKYISLNATIPVYVGNRQVARELKRIEAEDDFAYNG